MSDGFSCSKLGVQTSDATAPCTQSIECDPAWEQAARGVVAVYAINMRIRALGLCTGARRMQ